jgi:hypothetical protein
MPYTNQTPNYGLPQYIATDKPTYLGDANGAYSKLDTQMKANADAAATNQSSITLLSSRVLANETSIADRYTKAETAARFASRPSLGRNGNFRQPVNQRGETTYTGGGSGVYSIDGWKLTPGGNYNVTTRTLSGASYTARACGIYQFCELSRGSLAVGDTITVTLSVGGQEYTASMSLADRDAYSTFPEVPAGFSNDDFEIVPVGYSSSSPTIYTVGVYAKKALTLDYIKWEKGAIATPYQDPMYDEELLKCMRYYQRITYDVGFPVTALGQRHRFCMSFITPMRAKPSLSGVGSPYFSGCQAYSNSTTTTSFSIELESIAAGVSSGVMSANENIQLSAELG